MKAEAGSAEDNLPVIALAITTTFNNKMLLSN
jgi:hypothetical protein